jgi:hypothetical protein
VNRFLLHGSKKDTCHHGKQEAEKSNPPGFLVVSIDFPLKHPLITYFMLNPTMPLLNRLIHTIIHYIKVNPIYRNEIYLGTVALPVSTNHG